MWLLDCDRLSAGQRALVAASKNTHRRFASCAALAASAGAGRCWKLLLWTPDPPALKRRAEAALDPGAQGIQVSRGRHCH